MNNNSRSKSRFFYRYLAVNGEKVATPPEVRVKLRIFCAIKFLILMDGSLSEFPRFSSNQENSDQYMSLMRF